MWVSHLFFLWKILGLDGNVEAQVELNRCVMSEVLHGRWTSLAILGELVPPVFREFAGMEFTESLWLRGSSPLAFDDNRVTESAVHSDFLHAMLGCMTIFVATVRQSGFAEQVLEVGDSLPEDLGGKGKGQDQGSKGWAKEERQWLQGEVRFCLSGEVDGKGSLFGDEVV